MLELATWSIWAIKLFMESFTETSLIVFRNVYLHMELLKSMGERTTITKNTSPCKFPIFAHFSFVLCPESVDILGKMLLG
jgi:hypothetical protein